MKKTISISFIFIILSFGSCNYIAKERTRKDFYKGIITAKFIDERNHLDENYLFKSKTDTFFESGEIYPDSWEYANVGDSIIKEKGELYLTIKKKNGDSKMFPYWQ